jgi:hypothetical protein
MDTRNLHLDGPALILGTLATVIAAIALFMFAREWRERRG